jgi:hypothetical protein
MEHYNSDQLLVGHTRPQQSKSHLANPNSDQYLNCKSTAHIQLSTLTFGQLAKPNYNQYLNCKSTAHIQLSTLTFGPDSISPCKRCKSLAHHAAGICV